MFVVIEESIVQLSRHYDILGLFNTKEEASFLVNYKLNTSGVYQNNSGYYYNCFVEEVHSPLTVLPNQKLFLLVKSGIYTSGLNRQQLSEYCSTTRADYECVIGVFENIEDAKEEFIRLNDNIGFYFCIPFFTNGSYEEEDVLF